MKRKQPVKKPVTLLILGAGIRGAGVAEYAASHPDEVQVVGVAEPRDFHRNYVARLCGVPPEQTFTDWREAAEKPRFADAVVITTQDAMHTEPALAFAALKYHMLLEKPMAPTEEECERIVQAVLDNDVLLAVAHVLRYTPYTTKIKQIIDSGAIGDVVSLQCLEPVTYWHQAHSYVRGNWRKESESSSMLMAKSCHDLDWIRYIIGVPCRRVSSFGNTFHFKASARPPGAADRCLDCSIEPSCPYSAKRLYLGRVMEGHTGWPVSVLTTDTTVEGVTKALRTGPYGRCVYACDNDVVDHQVVNMEFEGGQSATFTMTGFNLHKDGGRETRIFGTHGEIWTNSILIKHTDYLTEETVCYDTNASGAMLDDGHGGGDYGLMRSFIDALARGDDRSILSGPEETLETHLMVFAAERSRKNRTIEDVPFPNLVPAAVAGQD